MDAPNSDSPGIACFLARRAVDAGSRAWHTSRLPVLRRCQNSCNVLLVVGLPTGMSKTGNFYTSRIKGRFAVVAIANIGAEEMNPNEHWILLGNAILPQQFP